MIYIGNQIRQEILIAKLRNEIDKRIRVALVKSTITFEMTLAQEIRKKIQAQPHFSIDPFNASNSELKTAREKIETARKSILEGDDFSAVAISISDSTNALEGD